MVDDPKNKDGIPDFDEENFDDVDFDATDDLDDGSYDDITDADADIDFDAESEEYAEEEWTEEPAPMAAKPGKKPKKDKNLYNDGYKKPLMSFNTMVIVGAFLLGASVLVYTVMSKTAEMNAGKKSIFRSMLNIGEVMDGGIFGDSKKDDTVADGSEAPAPQADANKPADQQGFLDNPAVLKEDEKPVSATDGTPPQPTPISPSETTTVPNEPLTPMPTDNAAVQAVPVVPLTAGQEQTPRAPDEYVDVAAVPEGDNAKPAEAPKSAADLLKEKMAEHQEKVDGKKTDEPTPSIPAPVTAEVKSAPVVPDAPPSTPVVAEPAPQVTPVASAPAGPSAEDIAKLKTAQDAADAATKKAADLQKKMDDMQARIDTLQSQLGTAKDSSQDKVAELQQTIQTLKNDLAAAKAAPVKVVDAGNNQAAPKPVSTPKKKTIKKKVATPAAKPAAGVYGSSPAYPPVAAASTGWELRAAQPGRAWVSKPGARDMQGVMVGQSLPGVGTITAINYQNGRWIVQGTQGQILQ